MTRFLSERAHPVTERILFVTPGPPVPVPVPVPRPLDRIGTSGGDRIGLGCVGGRGRVVDVLELTEGVAVDLGSGAPVSDGLLTSTP